MGEGGQRPAHRLEHLGLAEGVVQMVVAADDMGHAHVVIVHHHGKHVGGRAVGAQQHHVVELGIGNPHLALHKVADNGLALARRLEANCERSVPGRLRRVPVAPEPVVAKALAARGGCLPHRLEFLRRGIAAIGRPGRQHCPGDLCMARPPGELVARRFVGVEAEPGQPVEDRGDRRLRRAPAVRVLDAQQEPPAMAAREEPIE